MKKIVNLWYLPWSMAWSLTHWRLVLSILGLGSMGNACYIAKSNRPSMGLFEWIFGKIQLIDKFSVLHIRNLAKRWRFSYKPLMRSTDSIPIVSTSCCFLHWKCAQVLQKSLSIKQTCFVRYHHDLLRHLVAFSKFEWFMSSDPKIKNSSSHFVHKP